VGLASLPEIRAPIEAAPPALTSDLHGLLENWRGPIGFSEEQLPVVAAVAGDHSGWIALLADRDERLLVGDEGQGPTLDPHVLHRLAFLAGGAPTEARTEELSLSLASVHTWWQQRIAREHIRVLSPEGARLRSRVASRISELLTSAPRHLRAHLAASAAEARRTLRIPLSVGAERRLAALANPPVLDEVWLLQLAELGAGREAAEDVRPIKILALILIGGECA
jgi:hypothetical protein